jgi:superfamily I DNA/RNA helicase
MVSFTRTAVAELRQRIEALAKDVGAVAAVRITTLDAEAWNLGVSFQAVRTTEKLARGFDGNIEYAIALFSSNDPALCDWIAQTRHVIIDEAQDLVGRRSELVFQILDHLSNECGVTVFADPAQASYGFAEGDGDEGRSTYP